MRLDPERRCLDDPIRDVLTGVILGETLLASDEPLRKALRENGIPGPGAPVGICISRGLPEGAIETMDGAEEDLIQPGDRFKCSPRTSDRSFGLSLLLTDAAGDLHGYLTGGFALFAHHQCNVFQAHNVPDENDPDLKQKWLQDNAHRWILSVDLDEIFIDQFMRGTGHANTLVSAFIALAMREIEAVVHHLARTGIRSELTVAAHCEPRGRAGDALSGFFLMDLFRRLDERHVDPVPEPADFDIASACVQSAATQHLNLQDAVQMDTLLARITRHRQAAMTAKPNNLVHVRPRDETRVS